MIKMDTKKLKSDFRKKYDSLDDTERGQVCCIINTSAGAPEPASWNVANVEVRGNTKLSEKILRGLKVLGLI